MIRNIVLDMGNVLLDYDPAVPLKKFLDDEEDRKIIYRELFAGPEWTLGDLGQITLEEKYEAISRRIPSRLHEGLRKCLEGWHLFMPRVEGAMPFLQQAKRAGYRLYVLSNASDEFYIYFPKSYDMTMFEEIIVSADLHLIKPDERIYRYLLEHCSLCPQETLFIDDRLENVEGARRTGIQAVVFQNNFEKIKEQYKLW
ncbi:MAG: HAD family hydrolase [Ruminococcus sp.]|jgi:putative hydrolase of the HAD superfamily